MFLTTCSCFLEISNYCITFILYFLPSFCPSIFSVFFYLSFQTCFTVTALCFVIFVVYFIYFPYIFLCFLSFPSCSICFCLFDSSVYSQTFFLFCLVNPFFSSSFIDVNSLAFHQMSGRMTFRLESLLVQQAYYFQTNEEKIQVSMNILVLDRTHSLKWKNSKL